MKYVMCTGRIEKRQLVKSKVDIRKFIEAHLEMAQRMSTMRYIEIDITVNPDGGNHVPDGNS